MAKDRSRYQNKLLCVVCTVIFTGCSADTAKGRLVLAERLWTDGKYAAAVSEFEKVIQKDPKGKAGGQALFRAAMTETLYLNRHADAVRKFRAFIDQSEDLDAAWDAQKQIGEIYFNKTEQYDQAIIHYRALLKQKDGAVEAAEFLYRIARSHFFLWQFDDAIAVYKEIIRRNARTPWAERAAFEIGSTIFTKLAHESNRATSAEGYQEAIDAFEKFIRVYPKSQFVPEARFGIASCLESMDKLDMAYQHFETLKTSYPSPNVIDIKLVRIKERKAQRSQ